MRLLRSCRAPSLDQGGYVNEDAHSQVGMQITLCRAQPLCELWCRCWPCTDACTHLEDDGCK